MDIQSRSRPAADVPIDSSEDGNRPLAFRDQCRPSVPIGPKYTVRSPRGWGMVDR